MDSTRSTKGHRSLNGLARFFGGALLVAVCVALLGGAVFAVAPANAQPLTNGYPRLTTWWSGQSNPSVADVARFDQIIGGGWQASQLPDIRKINPNIIALWGGCASELPYDPIDLTNNDDIALVPAQWLLTQVGSTLSAAVDSTTKTIPIAAVSSGGVVRFKVGDSVVMGDEVAYVESVGTTALTVRRGVLRPATTHAAGGRVAAICSWYPHTAMMDLTAACPVITVDPAVGPETWSQYDARFGAGRVAQGNWDGIWTDRTDGNESWIIGGGNVRSIDPDRSNVARTDYSAFDTAWNTGLRTYEQQLRGLIGPDKKILTNQATPNYDLLNGTEFEDFPGGGQYTSWHSVMFGPNPRYQGSQATYLDWTTKALQPNLTTVVTRQAAGAIDYRNLRFGLTTALMGDGFYAYEISFGTTEIWADEFDGAGLGRGYLGQPTGPAQRALPNSITAIDVLRRDFDNGVVLVNATNAAVTVNLNGTFRKIKGAQAPTINDGSLVTAVTLPPQDGLVLLRVANTAPVANADSFATANATALNVSAPGVLGNDTDAEGNTLSASAVTQPVHGTLSLSANGSFAYTPDAGYAGVDSFTYRVYDGTLYSSATTVSINVAAHAPVAVADSYSTNAGMTLTVAPSGVLANDTDSLGHALTASVVTQPAHGTLSFLSDGSFVYVPTAGYSGADSFTYAVSDGTAVSPATTVSLTVIAPAAPSPTIVTKPSLKRKNRTATTTTYQVTGTMRLGSTPQVTQAFYSVSAATAPVVLKVEVQRYIKRHWRRYTTVRVTNPASRYTTRVRLGKGTFRVRTLVSGGGAPAATSAWTKSLRVR